MVGMSGEGHVSLEAEGGWLAVRRLAGYFIGDGKPGEEVGREDEHRAAGHCCQHSAAGGSSE